MQRYFQSSGNSTISILKTRKMDHQPTEHTRNGSAKICYLILPEGVTKEIDDGLKALSERYGVSFAMVKDVDWNDDLTPWPATGVFKKAKPFGGKARNFLEKLTTEIIPETEKSLCIENAERTLLGVSLSGLFVIWAGYQTDVFAHLISISGSLWYDGFTEWMSEQKFSESVESVCLMLGDREKNSKEKRMSTVEEKTFAAVDILKSQCSGKVAFELVEGTHFSPILPRLERAFETTFGITHQ